MISRRGGNENAVSVVFAPTFARIGRMFMHLKYIVGISLFILIVGAVLMAMYFRTFKQNDLMDDITQQMEATISSYNNTIWERYAAEITKNPASPYLPSFASETQHFFQKHGFAKITIFSPDVSKLYYGSGSDYVTSDRTTRVTLFDLDKVRAGQLIARNLKGVYLNGSADPNSERTMGQFILPLFANGSTTPSALMEVYIDISTKHSALNRQLQIFIGSVVGIFTLLIGVLLFTASRAELVIGKQHEVNLELIAAAASAEAQSREKSQFLASVSHELRTPLNAIIGFSEIIRNETKTQLEKIYQDYIEDIHASGKHLLSLINDILDYSKAEAGKLQIEWAETDATKIIRNSLRMVLPRAETAQVTLVEDIPSHHLVVVTDGKKLKQVLLNLLSNAVKFTPAGGEVHCHAWMDIIGGKMIIEVRDTGIGIAPKDISRVMTPFGQVDSALSRKYEGTGLGLPLSKKFVESMGGTFGIESELKVGTTVKISIPKAPPGWGTEAMDELNKIQDEPSVTS